MQWVICKFQMSKMGSLKEKVLSHWVREFLWTMAWYICPKSEYSFCKCIHKYLGSKDFENLASCKHRVTGCCKGTFLELSELGTEKKRHNRIY